MGKNKVTEFFIDIGYCDYCKSDVIKGAIFNPNKHHNCIDCGYMNRYNQELIKIDNKTNKVIYSTVYSNKKA